MNKQKLINFKNDLIERSKMYYDFASINENECESKQEFKISIELEKVAEKLEELIYED